MRLRLEVVFALIFILVVFFGFTAATYALASNWAFGGWGWQIAMLMGVGVMVFATLLTMAERKWSALMQDRVGPNRARISLPGMANRSLGGIPHIIADSVKMLTKEDHVPPAAGQFLFNIAPILNFAPVFCLFAVVPVAPEIKLFGSGVSLQVAKPDVGVLFVFAIASLAVYGTALAGWSSNNKLALLGGVRASSQMISYEVALGLSLVGIMVAFSGFSAPGIREGSFNSLRLEHLVAAQSTYLWSTRLGSFDIGLPAWGIILQPFGFVFFFAAAFAETKRAPFDLPEGESEIIGYFVEYSGMRFGMFMIGEFVEIVTLSGVTASVFFGGYHLPFGEQWLANQLQNYPLILGSLLGTVFWVKVLILSWLQLAIRWTFPRFRYDQVQRLGWKMLLPLGLANIFVTAALVLWGEHSLQPLALLGLAEIVIVLLLTFNVATAKTPTAPHPAPAH
jgi:NADH-quinone oxidoreductase subunit H